MPVEKDLKTAYKALYDEKEPLKALHLYDEILKGSPTNLTALIFKAACLEKLYFGFSDWHSDATMENAKELLDKALMTAEGRGDRSKIGLVNFRYFVHFFNIKDYELAQSYFKKAKNLGYVDDTLPLWEDRLETKLNKKIKSRRIQLISIQLNQWKVLKTEEIIILLIVPFHLSKLKPLLKNPLNLKSIGINPAPLSLYHYLLLIFLSLRNKSTYIFLQTIEELYRYRTKYRNLDLNFNTTLSFRMRWIQKQCH